MSPAEIFWRGHRAIQTRMERNGRGIVPYPPPPHDVWGCTWLDVPASGLDASQYMRAAERILSGNFDLFSLRDLKLDFPPCWNRDPKTGKEVPLHFGKAIDYRDEQLVGNIKYLWQLNRHYELVTLAQAFCLSKQEEYAYACRVLLDSWFQQCPYPFGVNWACSLEHGVRLTNWSVAWHLLGGHHSFLFKGETGKSFMHRWLDSIYQHCHFVARNTSRFSSANNHLIGEYMGLFIGATTWPCWEQSTVWRDLAKRGLEEEALRQNATDGVNLEQAIWYHHEVGDMMLLCALCGQQNGIAFSGEYWKRLEAMLTFITAIMDVAGNVPMIGDSDDALMVKFSQEPDFNAYRSLLTTGAVIFSRPDFKRKAGRFDDKSRWLTGNIGAKVFAALPANEAFPPAPYAFRQGGYYILGADFETSSEVKIVADAGPLGHLSIAAHGHADALSFTLSVSGKEMLIDPGTYAYHTQKKWRDYFRGTSAHNTVRIDGIDQSEIGGNFMWLRKANAVCEVWNSDEEKDCFGASHDGYMRLSDPVMHRRKIVYYKRERTLLVEDAVHCRAPHEVEFWWHFSEGSTVTILGKKVVVNCGNVQLEMQMQDSACVPELLFGKEHPPAGWISRRFDEKQPCSSLRWKEKINQTSIRNTIIQIEL
jgi:hypothetical protein